MSLPPFAPENLGAAVAAVLPEMQKAAESRMHWTCRVEREPAEDAPWVTNPETGYEEPPAASVIYRGMFRIRSFRPYETTPDVGGSTVTLVRKDAHLPAVERIPVLAAASTVEAVVSAQPFREGDVIVREVDGQDVARYRIASSFDTTEQTAQRLLVDEGA